MPELKFIDLAAQQRRIKDKIDAAIARVLAHGQYIMGPEVTELEQALQTFTGAKHALACANGTDALTLTLMAWGVGAGDAVFVPSFTYVASAEAPALLGATPFFVDVLENTFNIDPNSFAQAIIDAKSMGLRPAAVIPVDLFGQPADSDAICDIARPEGIKVLIDGAQSFGAMNKNRRMGTMGDATTTSFFPAKPLGCYGDGGAVFTQDDELAARINSVRLHGRGREKYDNIRIGMNSRLDTLQAAILLEKLKIFPDELMLRTKVAHAYDAVLMGTVKTPILAPDMTSAWAQYTLIFDGREGVQARLKQAGVPSVVYYPKPLTQQAGYQHFPTVSGGTPVSEALASKVLSLPMYPYLDADEVITRLKGLF